MTDNYLQSLKEKIVSFLKDENVKIILFGSRARKENNNFSDVDIGIIPYGKVDKSKITLLKEEMENLNIPYRVEIVDFSETSENFKKEAMKDIIVWKD